MATAHLKECVQKLIAASHEIDRSDLPEGFAAVFELIDQPWDFSGDKDVLVWREGYEQCMKDIVDAIADEWGVLLPPDPLRCRTKENTDGGEGQ